MTAFPARACRRNAGYARRSRFCSEVAERVGFDGGTIDPTDMSNLKRVADAFPQEGFETFVMLAKLCPFTPQEIEAAKALNETYGLTGNA